MLRVAGLFGQFQRPLEVFLALLEVLLGAGDHAQLEAALHLSSVVLHLRRQLQVLLDEELHLVLVVGEVLGADLADVAHRHRLAAQVGHLDGVLERVLEVVNAVLLIAQPVVAEAEVDRGEELAVYVGEAFVESVVLDRLPRVFRLSFSDELVVDSDAVVGQRFSVAVVDALADLQKLQVVLHSLLVLLDVVIEHSNRIIRPALVSYFPCPSAPKGQHLVILQPPHHSHIGGVINLLLELPDLVDC